MALLGQLLGGEGAVSNRELREELLAAARTIAYDERYLSSCEATVLDAAGKSEVKEALGRSPDHLDATAMAV